jgi:glycine cleavage system H protein
MKFPKDLRYTEEHEWIMVEGNIASIGITDYAQNELGDIVYVELPEIGTDVKQMEVFGTIEAVKAVSDLFAPVSGQVVEVNTKLVDEPETVNKDPYADGWMIKVQMSDPKEVENLLDSDDYKEKIK